MKEGIIMEVRKNSLRAINEYRKCFKCGSITQDIQKDTCKCGGYMYMISTYYTPKIRAKKARKGGK